MKQCLISIEFNVNYWASPWIFIVIKYILLININNWYFSHVFGSKLPSYSRCCTINLGVIISIAQPWRHHWNVISCERHVVDVWQSSSLSWFLGSSCGKYNYVFTVVENSFGAHWSVIWVFTSINANTFILWSHQQFATLARTLFAIYFLSTLQRFPRMSS